MTEDVFGEIFRAMPARKPRAPQTFRLGDTVRIISGPFANFTGRIEGINQARSLLKVAVTIFGQAQPIKLSFRDAEKVSGT